MKRKLLSLLLPVILVFAMIGPAFADIGPKPSVRISFTGGEGAVFYGTLLSEESSTGPASAYEKFESRYMTQDNRRVEGPEAETLWQAFQNYAEEDEFYFLQQWWSCSESSGMNWTYYPPETFKLLLYCPETHAYRVSAATERYAFDSLFTVDLSGEGELVLERSYHYGPEILSFLIRAALTIALELAVVWLFGYREKRQLAFLALVNGATQIGLNLYLSLTAYHQGSLAFTASYLLGEVLVTAAEAFLYANLLPRCSEKRTGKGLAVSYALASNLLSFGAGMLLAHLIPGIF